MALPAAKGSGVAAQLIEELRRTGVEHGLAEILAPVRPTRKHLYPLTCIEEYASWTRDDGLPFDPWLRLHVRLGGRIIALAPAAQTMTGTVAEWESWSKLALPASGDYIITNGMSPLNVDRESDLATYVEANVWVRHTRVP